jgi:hypothetical protein
MLILIMRKICSRITFVLMLGAALMSACVVTPDTVAFSADTQRACKTTLTSLVRRSLSNDALIRSLVMASAPSPGAGRSACVDALAQDLHRDLLKRRPMLSTPYDVLVIGAGVHSSIFNYHYLRSHSAKVLTLEKNDQVVQFFNTYSTRVATLVNDLPGTPIQIGEYSDEKFPPAQVLWNQSVLLHFLSGADYLFGTGLSDDKSKGATLSKDDKGGYRLTTPEGASFGARQVVLAIGQGEPRFLPGSDAQWIAKQRAMAQTCMSASCIPQWLSYEDFVQLDRNLSERGTGVAKRLAGKRVALVGAGDAAKGWLEYLYCGAPKGAYPMDAMNQHPGSLTWYGQTSSTYAQFAAANGSNSRYVLGIFGDFYRNLLDNRTACKAKVAFETNAEHVNSISPGAFDYVLLALGYVNTTMDLLKPMGSASMQDVDVAGSHVAARFGDEQIYVIGSAAQSLASGGLSIEVLAPKTAQFARFLKF